MHTGIAVDECGELGDGWMEVFYVTFLASVVLVDVGDQSCEPFFVDAVVGREPVAGPGGKFLLFSPFSFGPLGKFDRNSGYSLPIHMVFFGDMVA